MNYKKDIFKFLLLSFLFVLPFWWFQCVNDDFHTHISRIYNLSISFKQNNFNPYMYQSCYNKYGYPFGIFYPDTFLKPFAFLTYLGIPIYISSIFMLFCINFFTFLTPYLLLKRINKTRKYAYIISVIYFIYPYRFFDYVNRFSIGELMFFIFFPMILFGLYQIFQECKFSYFLFLGFYGIFHSHILSIFLILIFCLCFYIANIKIILEKKQIIKWTMINGIIILFSCIDVYLPILESQIKENLLYENNITFLGSLNENTIQLINQNRFTSFLGLIIVIMLIICIIYSKNIIIKSILDIIILILISTNLFNWNWILKLFPFLNIIQFPFRCFVFGCIPFSYLFFVFYHFIKQKLKISILKIIILIQFIITIIFSYIYLPFNFDKMSKNIGAGDYINYEVDITNLSFLDKNIRKDADIESKEYLVENGYLPIFYFNNYKIYNNKKSYNYENKEGLIYIFELKDEYTKVIVDYQETYIQKLSYYISLVTTIGIISYFLYKICLLKKEH